MNFSYIHSCIVILRFKAGEVIYSIGDESREFFLILDLPPPPPTGSPPPLPNSTPPRNIKSTTRPTVELVKFVPTSDSSMMKKVTTRLTKDNYFGHKSFMSNKPVARSANASAITHICVACIYPESFSKWSNFRSILVCFFY